LFSDSFSSKMTIVMTETELRSKINAYILADQPDEAEFNTLAIALHHYQLTYNKPYQAFVIQISGDQQATTWQDIPALPTDAFKAVKHPPSCLQPSEWNTTFKTSGTTQDVKGEHHFRDTDIYETSILAGWKQCQLRDLEHLIILTPSPEDAPHSSLSHMMETIRRDHGEGEFIVNANGSIDIERILKASNGERHIAILGTALAFLHLFELLNAPLPLPIGSWALETGGYKGSRNSLTKEQLYRKFQDYLAIPPDKIWNEYSMTELSSQFYTSNIGRPHLGPHWTRIRVINPETGQPQPYGTPGYLIIYDLANIDSCIAIQTQDIAIAHDERNFTLIGRDPAALPRGCSRSADEHFSRT